MKRPLYTSGDDYDFGIVEHVNLRLVRSAYACDARGVEEALHEGANVDAVSRNGFTPLVWVAFQSMVGDDPVQAAECLIDAGASVNYVVPNSGATPLTMACQMGHVDLTKFLIQRGAEVNTPPGAEIPLHEAIGTANSELVKLLLDYGADRTRHDALGRTAVDLARSYDAEGVLRMLLT